MTVPPPSDTQQLAFLAKIQRMLEEGQFTATYKFALLVALTDIAVERGRDDGSSIARSPHAARREVRRIVLGPHAAVPWRRADAEQGAQHRPPRPAPADAAACRHVAAAAGIRDGRVFWHASRN